MVGFSVETAQTCSDEEIREATQDAFSDYPVQLDLSPTVFGLMMRQRGFDRSASRVARVAGGIAAVWLVSGRADRAYLVASGTRPEFRGHRIARTLGEDCLAALRRAGIRTFQTEVLRDNSAALSLYQALGMTIVRRFDCYVIPFRRRGDITGVEQIRWEDLSPAVDALRDWEPSWQNDDSSMEAVKDQLSCGAHFDTSGLAGFVIANQDTRALHQIAVRRDVRRKGIGQILMRFALEATGDRGLRIVNVDSNDVTIQALLRKFGAEAIPGQFELMIRLT